MRLLLLLFFSLPLAHDFHVSIAQVDYKDQELQCTLRLFTDDLVQRLEKEHLVSLKLGSEQEYAGADSLIAAYVEREFRLKAPGQEMKQIFLGKEVEYELIYIYFYYECPQAPKQLEVSNRVFFDSFDDQSNIVNVKIEGELRSAFLNSSETKQTLKF